LRVLPRPIVEKRERLTLRELLDELLATTRSHTPRAHDE